MRGVTHQLRGSTSTSTSPVSLRRTDSKSCPDLREMLMDVLFGTFLGGKWWWWWWWWWSSFLIIRLMRKNHNIGSSWPLLKCHMIEEQEDPFCKILSSQEFNRIQWCKTYLMTLILHRGPRNISLVGSYRDSSHSNLCNPKRWDHSLSLRGEVHGSLYTAFVAVK